MSTEPTSHPDLPVSSEGVGLSTDALVVLKSYFGFGPKTSVEVGGKYAQSVLSDRARAAMTELIDAGFVTVEAVGRDGREKFTGTGKKQPRTTVEWMETHGRWSGTVPNPARAAISQATRSEPST